LLSDLAGGANSAPSDPLAGLVLLLRSEREGDGRGGEGRGKKRRGN